MCLPATAAHAATASRGECRQVLPRRPPSSPPDRPSAAPTRVSPRVSCQSRRLEVNSQTRLAKGTRARGAYRAEERVTRRAVAADARPRLVLPVDEEHRHLKRRCSFDKRASPLAPSSRLLGTRSMRAARLLLSRRLHRQSVGVLTSRAGILARPPLSQSPASARPPPQPTSAARVSKEHSPRPASDAAALLRVAHWDSDGVRVHRDARRCGAYAARHLCEPRVLVVIRPYPAKLIS